MDALVIGPPRGLADAAAGTLRRRGMTVLRAIAADASDRERASWLLEEAGWPPLVIVVEGAPYEVVRELLPLTLAHVVLVAEQRSAAHGGAPRQRAILPREEPGLTVLPLGRAGRRWFVGGRRETMGAARAAAVVIKACDAIADSRR
jgi:hypothetical protein